MFLNSNLLYLLSFLRKLDKKNFDQERIELYYEKTIDYVYDLFIDTVDEYIIVDALSQEKDMVENLPEIQAGMDGMDITEQELELYSHVHDDIESENIVVTNRQLVRERMRMELRNKIKNSLEEYKTYCKSIKMLTYLEENGNEFYKNIVEKKKLEVIRIQSGDALYVSKFFDVTKWWMKHETKFPELAMGASILLGKPTHNAFQERVFSRGTYSDTKLRKRLKEQYFEMSIINSVNGKQIDEIYHLMQPSIMLREKDKQKELKSFMEKRKNELDLTIETGDDDDDYSTVPEYTSVCSINTDVDHDAYGEGTDDENSMVEYDENQIGELTKTV